MGFDFGIGFLPSSRLLPRFLRIRQMTRAMLSITIMVPTMATTMMMSLGRSPRPPRTWFNRSSRSPKRGWPEINERNLWLIIGNGRDASDLPCETESGMGLVMVDDTDGGGVFLVGGEARLFLLRLTIQTMAETLRASNAVATSTMMTTQRPGSLVEASLPTLEEGTGVGGASPGGRRREKLGSHRACRDLAHVFP